MVARGRVMSLNMADVTRGEEKERGPAAMSVSEIFSGVQDTFRSEQETREVR